MKTGTAILASIISFIAFTQASTAPVRAKDISIDMHPYQDFEQFRDRVYINVKKQGTQEQTSYQEVMVINEGGTNILIVRNYTSQPNIRLVSEQRAHWRSDALIIDSMEAYGPDNSKRTATVPAGGFVVLPALVTKKTKITRTLVSHEYNPQYGWIVSTSEYTLSYEGTKKISVMGVSTEAVVMKQDITWTSRAESTGQAWGPSKTKYYFYYAAPYGCARIEYKDPSGKSIVHEIKDILTRAQFEQIKRSKKK